jgi:hypothetical protein
MPSIDELIVRMRTVGASTAAAEVGTAERGIRTLGSTAKQVAGVAGLAGLAFGLKDVAQAAIGFQQQQAQLANALHNTGQYSAGAMDRITSFADTLSTHGGYDPGQTLEGVQKLIRAHDSVAQAMHDEILATDIARSKQTSYATALRTIAIVEQGRTTNLARLGIAVTQVHTAQDALAASHIHATVAMKEQAKAQDAQATKVAALATLWHRFGGSVEAFSHGPAGAISNFEHSVDILAQHLGNVLQPVITAVTTSMTWLVHAADSVLTFLQHHKAVVESFAISVGILAIAWAAVNADIIATAIAFGILAPAMAVIEALMSPWLLALVAIAGVVYLVITHFQWLKTAAVDAFHWVLHAAEDTWDWVRDHWPLLATILFGPIGFAAQYIIRHWGDVKQAFVDVWDWIKGAWHTLEHTLEWPFVQAWHVIQGIVEDVKRAVHTITHPWDAVDPLTATGQFHLQPGYAVRNGQVVHVGPTAHPGRASGGPVYSGGMYEVGEQGRELVYMNVLQIGGREFYRAMNESTATVAASR